MKKFIKNIFSALVDTFVLVLRHGFYGFFILFLLSHFDLSVFSHEIDQVSWGLGVILTVVFYFCVGSVWDAWFKPKPNFLSKLQNFKKRLVGATNE